MARLKTLRNILRYAWYKVLYTVSATGHRNGRRMAFGSWFGNKYDDNPRALFEYTIAKRPDIQACWITKSKSVVRELRSQGLPVLHAHSLRALWWGFTSKYLVYCTSPDDMRFVHFFPLMGHAIYINLWHGVPLKKIKYDDAYAIEHKRQELMAMPASRRFWQEKIDKLMLQVEADSYHIATSDDMVRIYQGVFNAPASRILNLGQARNDYFYREHLNPIRQRFPNQRIVAYMPTHRKQGTQAIDLRNLFPLPELNAMLQSHNAVMLVKKHFYHNHEHDLQDGQYSNIVDLTGSDVKSQDLIEAADILISDYSSAYIDYLLLDRPIYFFAYDLDDYLSTDRQMYLEYAAENMPGEICISTSQLLKALDSCLEGNDDMAHLRRKMRNYYYSEHNRQAVAATQLDAILSIDHDRHAGK